MYDLLIPKKKFNQALELLNEDEAQMEQEELDLEEQESAKQEEETKAPKKKKWYDWFR